MSKKLKLKLSPTIIHNCLESNNINTMSPKFHTNQNQNKLEHIIINSDRYSKESKDEILKNEKIKNFNRTFYEKETKKIILIVIKNYHQLIIKKVMKDINSRQLFIKKIKI